MQAIIRPAGFAYAIVAYLLFSSMDTCVKFLAELPSLQVMAYSQVVALVWLLGWFRLRQGNWQFIPARPWRLLLIRGALFFGVVALAFYSLPRVTLPSFYAVIFTSPLLVSVLAAIFLKEYMRPVQWLALLLGFAGVLIVYRPWENALNPALLAVVGCALVHAAGNVLARHLTQQVSAATNVTWMLVVGVGLAVIFGVQDFVPLTVNQMVLLLMAGSFAGAAHILFIHGLYLLPAGPLAMTHYSQIIWGISFGWIFWQQLPDMQTFIGAGLIIGAGVTMLRLCRVPANAPLV